ncbi:unnamed protein product, partial [Ectocarpus fasciculatus]
PDGACPLGTPRQKHPSRRPGGYRRPNCKREVKHTETQSCLTHVSQVVFPPGEGGKMFTNLCPMHGRCQGEGCYTMVFQISKSFVRFGVFVSYRYLPEALCCGLFFFCETQRSPCQQTKR